MADAKPPTFVMVPGLRGHVEDHWQTLLATELDGVVTVPPLERDGLSRDARVAALDKVLAGLSGPVFLVAHSAGALIAVHWAQQHRRPIQGALLVCPPDPDVPLPAGHPSPEALADNGWLPTPREQLPFPSLVAASTNDPLAAYGRVVGMARDWGSRLVVLGEVGHLNPASGHGPLPQGRELLGDLVRHAARPAEILAGSVGAPGR